MTERTMRTGWRENGPLVTRWHASLRATALMGVLVGMAMGIETGSEATGLGGTGLAAVLSDCEPDYPPYCIVTPANQADGFSVELLRAALKAVGREVVFKTGPWDEIKQALADGRLQALPLVGRTPEREASFDFTFPYLTMHGAIVGVGKITIETENVELDADYCASHVEVTPGEVFSAMFAGWE